MITWYGRERRAGLAMRRAALLAVASALAGAACGRSEETSAGDSGGVIATASAAEPAPGGTTQVAVTASATATLGAVTYGDAERLYRSEQYGEASELFEAYTLRKPDNVWGHYMLGISAWKSGNHEKAEGALRRTIEIDPKHAKALVNLSRVVLEQNRPAAALDFAEEAVVVAPKSSEAWRVLGNVRSELRVFDAAADAYRRALALNEQDYWSMNNLGQLMIRQGRYEDALPPLARAVQLEPGNAVFQNNLGVALERNGHLVEAAEAYRAVLDAKPDHAAARVSLARVEEQVVIGDWAPVDVRFLADAFAAEIALWCEQLVRDDTTSVEMTGTVRR